MDTIILKSVGTGRSLSNLSPLETKIEIASIEWHSFHDGEVTTTPVVMEKTTTDSAGKISSSEVMATSTISAEWMPSGSNRFTAPNIRVGEQVEILQQGDSDIYYWRPWGRDEHLRKLETIIWGISATPNEGDDSYSPENRYWIEFSSHSKKIFLTTSRKNGEYSSYHIGLDLEKGTFQIVDEKQNEARLDSQYDRWFFTTALKCSIEMIGEHLNLSVPGNFDWKVGGNVTIKIGGNYSDDIAGNFSSKVGGNYTQDISGQSNANAKGGFMWKGGGSTMWLNSSSHGWTAPSTQGGQ